MRPPGAFPGGGHDFHSAQSLTPDILQKGTGAARGEAALSKTDRKGQLDGSPTQSPNYCTSAGRVVSIPPSKPGKLTYFEGG